MCAMRKSTSRNVNGYVKAALALEAVRQKREERYTLYVRALDRKRDRLAAEGRGGPATAGVDRDPAGRGAAHSGSRSRSPYDQGPHGVTRDGSHLSCMSYGGPKGSNDE
jgi:hypothetical protein